MVRPILIVGAGPTGLVMALWLSKAGIPVRIIEKNAGPGEASRAMAVQARTLELYQLLGIADRIVAAGIPVHAMHLRRGREDVATLPFSDAGQFISPFPFILSLPQDIHERLLIEELSHFGVAVEWNSELMRFRDDGDSVSAEIRRPEEDEIASFSYVCGCDGVHSSVRQGLRLEFPGGTYDQMFYVADVVASGTALNQDVNVSADAESLLLGFPIRSEGTFRLVGIVPKEFAAKSPVDFEDLRPLVKAQIDAEVQAVNWFSTYHVHHRVAEHFRVGRVFIAGDAGHVHSPAGGQGMNTGIGDAVNLSWKLGAVLSGTAPESILDSYEPERIEFAKVLVHSTDRAFRAVVGTNLQSRAIRRFLVPRFGPLMLRLDATRNVLFRLVSQTQIHYSHSELSEGVRGSVQGGDRLPWLPNSDIYDQLSSARWSLICIPSGTSRVTEMVGRFGIKVIDVEFTQEAQSAGFAADSAYLVRPDGYVGAAFDIHEPDLMLSYLEKWFTLSVEN